jgi:hypothetical protein
MKFNQIKKQIIAVTTGASLVIGAALSSTTAAQADSTFNAVFSNQNAAVGITNASSSFHFGFGFNPWNNHNQGYYSPGYNNNGWNNNNNYNQPKRKRYVVTGGSRRGFIPLRARPGKRAQTVARIPHHSKRVFGKGRSVRRHGISWTKVRFHGQVGWVKTRQIRRLR